MQIAARATTNFKRAHRTYESKNRLASLRAAHSGRRRGGSENSVAAAAAAALCCVKWRQFYRWSCRTNQSGNELTVSLMGLLVFKLSAYFAASNEMVESQTRDGCLFGWV